MNKVILYVSIMFSTIFFQLTVYAGSYLFCASENATGDDVWIEGKGWNWAKGMDINNPKTEISEIYKDFSHIYANGTWISGTGDIASKIGIIKMIIMSCLILLFGK